MTALAQSRSATLPQPVVNTWLWEDSVRLLAFGKPHDWSLRLYQGNTPKSELETRAPSLYLPKIAVEYGLGKFLYAPSPRHFNAEVCTEAETMKLRVGIESRTHHNTIWLYRGEDADGLVLGRGHTYAVSAAGCPVLILKDHKSDTVGVAHAGRQSLIDEERLKGKPARKHENVVMSLLDAMRCITPESCRALEAIIAFPIAPEVLTYLWDDPVYGEFNILRSRFVPETWGAECTPGFGNRVDERSGQIDPAMLLRSQLLSRGLLPEHVSVILPPSRGEWYDTREPGQDPLARNLILVQHL